MQGSIWQFPIPALEASVSDIEYDWCWKIVNLQSGATPSDFCGFYTAWAEHKESNKVCCIFFRRRGGVRSTRENCVAKPLMKRKGVSGSLEGRTLTFKVKVKKLQQGPPTTYFIPECDGRDVKLVSESLSGVSISGKNELGHRKT